MSEGFYDWLLFLHIFGAMVWVGGGVLLGAVLRGFSAAASLALLPTSSRTCG
jgi:uncharacterized membrane protein